MIKHQYTLYLENKRGVLARIAKLLSRAEVNIEGISVAESTHTALVQLIPSNAAKARKALNDAGIPYTSQKVVVTVLDHKTGALADVATKLAKAKVNINYIYATAADRQKDCCLVVSASDIEKVEAALKQK